ncbi:MAG: hypothetical protein ABIC04_00795 [Nanoarchaeota archaeon]
MDKFHLKAQSAMEFILLAGLLLFIFLIVLSSVSYNTAKINKKKDALVGEDIVTKVQKELNLAARVLDGYSREFYLPQLLSASNYTISLNQNKVIIKTDNHDHFRIIPNITGKITKGINKINKTNGIIYLN